MESERESTLQEQKSASRKAEEVEALQQELQAARLAQQARLSQIKSQTAALHASQERMEKVHNSFLVLRIDYGCFFTFSAFNTTFLT